MATALVTGATAGLGAEFARQLAAEGNGLVLVARDQVRLAAAEQDLEDRFGIPVEVLSADLSSADGRAAVTARILSQDEPIDLLVNNAGIGLYRAFGKASIDDEDGMLDVNVRAVLQLSHAAVQAMKPRGHGMILNVASVAGFVPRPETVTYGAGKAYVVAFTEGLSQLLAGSGVTASVVCPGFTHTEFHDRAQVDMSYLPSWMWLEAEKVVSDGLAGVRHGRTVIVPDIRYKTVVGASRLLPRSLIRRLGASGSPQSRR